MKAICAICVKVSQKTEDDIGVEDGVGAGSWTETLWKNRKCCYPLSYTCKPLTHFQQHWKVTLASKVLEQFGLGLMNLLSDTLCHSLLSTWWPSFQESLGEFCLLLTSSCGFLKTILTCQSICHLFLLTYPWKNSEYLESYNSMSSLSNWLFLCRCRHLRKINIINLHSCGISIFLIFSICSSSFSIWWRVRTSSSWPVSAHSGEETHMYIWAFQWSRFSLDPRCVGWGLCLHFKCSSWVNWMRHILTLELQATLRLSHDCTS